MDVILNHLVNQVGAIRETQLRQGGQLDQLVEQRRSEVEQRTEGLDLLRSLSKRKPVTPLVVWKDYLQPLGPMAALWGSGVFIVQYLARGGDLSTLMAKLLGGS